MHQSVPDLLLINSPTKVVGAINVYERNDYNGWFEKEYESTVEPWNYSHRGAELYRHIRSVQKIRKYNAAPQTLLELGCSKGLMTEMLIPFSRSICAADISLTALKACEQRCTPKAVETSCKVGYFQATVPTLPFAADSFDIVTVCDGLAAWYLPDDQQRLALQDIWRVLKKGGFAILTDCLMPEHNKGEFEAYEAIVKDSPLIIIETSFLYDKPWYMLEGLLKKTGLERKFRSILVSIRLSKMLNSMGSLLGRKAARHIVIIVRKDG